MNAVLSAPAGSPGASLRSALIVVLGLWLALVCWLAVQGAFTVVPGEVPVRVMAGVGAPVIAFLLAYRLSGSFRELVLNADPGFLVGMQAWRFLGFGFLALHAYGLLPGIFAWPAGVGDMAVAAAAPWIVLALARNPRFAASGRFLAWNWLGILDLMVAVGAGAAASGLVPALTPDGVTTERLSQLPLALVPAYLVPLFFMFHIASLLQAKRARNAPAIS
jgi:hypothetical protein